MTHTRITIQHISRQELMALVASSKTFKDLANQMGYCPGSPFNKRIRIKLTEFQIDHDHLRQPHLGRTQEEIVDGLFVENSTTARAAIREHAKRRGLVPYVCRCGNPGEWLGKPLSLQLHHKSGNSTDNRLQNLEFVCPNCHSQEPTTNRANTKPKPREEEILAAFPSCSNMRQLIQKIGAVDCGGNYRMVKKTLKAHGLAFDMANFSEKTEVQKAEVLDSIKIAEKQPQNSRLHCRKVNWPSKVYLEQLLWEKPTGHIGKEFGVSGGAVEKWCSTYGITSKPPRGYWAKRASGMTHDEALLPPKPKQKRTERKLSQERVVSLLRDLSEDKESLRSLSRCYGVSRRTITAIREHGGYRSNGASSGTPTQTNSGSNPE